MSRAWAATPQDSRIETQALQWQVALWSGEVQEHELQAFRDWLQADPEHQAAWERVERFGRQMQAAPQDVAAHVLRAGLSPQAVQRRRSILRGLLLVAGGGLTAYGVGRTPHWAHWNADYRTGRGQRAEWTLPDGTQLALNTDSALDVQYDMAERRLVLLAGEVLVTTSPDTQSRARPLVVHTAQGTVQALGTRFLVRQYPDGALPRVSVQVYDGAVQLQAGHSGRRLRLDAGQQAFFNQIEFDGLAAADVQALAWQRGLLVAERWRLADFLRELARYRSGVLRCDPAVADLIVSGVYPLRDTDAILQSLAQALPVRISRVTPYWVTVSAQP
ncbi:MAG TPA: FecR domain-containing protein [Alcaligenes sp.]|nr:FecR domain-containing protein [Alcaligenes sp.]HRL26459.1 FecR domain-containing protein [Alcaligenes sp.]